MTAKFTITFAVLLLSLFAGHVITKAMNNHIYYQLENSQNGY